MDIVTGYGIHMATFIGQSQDQCDNSNISLDTSHSMNVHGVTDMNGIIIFVF